MKIPFPFDFSEDKMSFMRRCGYGVFQDPNTGITSYTKRLQGGNYPRFHVYIETDKDSHEFISLHLDQKKPSYIGVHAHSADYKGEPVDSEGSRLAGLIKNKMDNQKQEDKIQGQPQGWFAKLFK